MFEGILPLSWWQCVLYTIFVTHITIVAVTVFLHRCQAHRSLRLHPVCSHAFRLWLWLATGMLTKEWVAIHRKHHAKVETEEDPHSPVYHGIREVLFKGAELYRKEAANEETLRDYGHQTPDDWLERNLYSNPKFTNMGVVLMLVINVALFGVIGLTIWAAQMAMIPFFAAGVINGLGHWKFGYRNFPTDDTAVNLVPWGTLIGGEELHNNHHAFPGSAKFSCRRWEFDIGWAYIRLLRFFGLAEVKKVFPTPALEQGKSNVDENTLDAVLMNRLHVLAAYRRQVLRKVCSQQNQPAQGAAANGGQLYARLKPLLNQADRLRSAEGTEQLNGMLAEHESLRVVYEFRQRLHALWTEKNASKEALIKKLQEWCQQAEKTGIEALEQFASYLRSYTMQPA